jgi:hypothetical protein
MQIDSKQQEIIQRIANDSDGKHLLAFFKNLASHLADVRTMTNVSAEEVKAKQLACSIIEDEIINRFKRKTSEEEENNDNYE